MSANCCQTVRFPTPARSAMHEARGRRSPSPCSVRIASTIARRVRRDLAARPSAGRPSASSPRISARSSLASSVPRIETRRSSDSEENGACRGGLRGHSHSQDPARGGNASTGINVAHAAQIPASSIPPGIPARGSRPSIDPVGRRAATI